MTEQQQGPVDGHTVTGIPYAYPPQPPPPQYFYGAEYVLPRRLPGPINAVYGHPNGISLAETFFGDTPAPLQCPHCSFKGLTIVKSKPSMAACVACLVSVVGICFLCPSGDCLWNKQHYCPNCGNKVGEFTKSDPCMVFDAVKWVEPSYAIPA